MHIRMSQKQNKTKQNKTKQKNKAKKTNKQTNKQNKTKQKQYHQFKWSTKKQRWTVWRDIDQSPHVANVHDMNQCQLPRFPSHNLNLNIVSQHSRGLQFI